MAKRKSTYYRWSAKIDRETLPTIQALAANLGFIVETPGGFEGNPSPPAMLDALAAAYRRDPAGVKLAFRVLGITPDGQPTVTIGDSAEQPAE